MGRQKEAGSPLAVSLRRTNPVAGVGISVRTQTVVPNAVERVEIRSVNSVGVARRASET